MIVLALDEVANLEGGVTHASPQAILPQFERLTAFPSLLESTMTGLPFQVGPEDALARHVEVVAVDQAEDLAHGSATRQ